MISNPRTWDFRIYIPLDLFGLPHPSPFLFKRTDSLGSRPKNAYSLPRTWFRRLGESRPVHSGQACVGRMSSPIFPHAHAQRLDSMSLSCSQPFLDMRSLLQIGQGAPLPLHATTRLVSLPVRMIASSSLLGHVRSTTQIRPWNTPNSSSQKSQTGLIYVSSCALTCNLFDLQFVLATWLTNCFYSEVYLLLQNKD